MTLLPDRLLVVTDRRLSSRDLPSVIHEVVSAGARWVWFRDKDLGDRERLALALEVQKAIGGRAALTIGSDVQIARELGVRAVHLSMSADVASARRQLGAGALIGLSAHSLADVVLAKAVGADYVTLSPIFETASKPGYGPPLGVSSLIAASAVGIPIVALGGVVPANVEAVMAAGASAIAVMGGICGDRDIPGRLRAYRSKIADAGMF